MLKDYESPGGARETGYTIKGRQLCYEPIPGGVELWLKGTQGRRTLHWDKAFQWAQEGSFSIKARPVSDAQLAKIVERRETTIGDVAPSLSDKVFNGVVIHPTGEAGAHAQGQLSARLPKSYIDERLGFLPNVEDDPHKVKYSWGFTADGHACGIWDYKGSRWSTYGPREVFEKLFPDYL